MNISHKGGVGHLLKWRFDRVVLSVRALSTIIIIQIKASLGKTRQGERFFLPDEEARDDCLYLSAIPWLCFTGLTHAENLDRDDAIPRISWGRWFWLGDRLLLPFSVQAHHALVDGVHLGQFIDALQKKLDAF